MRSMLKNYSKNCNDKTSALKPALCAAALCAALLAGCSSSADTITLTAQGAYSAGGSVIEAKEPYDPYHPKAEGMSLHGDHVSVLYQIPEHARALPVFMLHGAGQSARTYMSTPDGRDGLQNILLKHDYAVYLIDGPRRGQAGRSTVPTELTASPDNEFWYGQFRMGLYPERYTGSQFPEGSKALEQFFRQMTPATGPYDAVLSGEGIAAAIDSSGFDGGIVITHSQGGSAGWRAAMLSDKVKAIASYEPGSGFVFPQGEVPAPIANHSFFGDFTAEAVPLEDFMALTRIPIVIYYGDFIPKAESDNPHTDYWRAAVKMAREFAACINRHGGHAEVIELPDVGIHGNTHFMFAERNNAEVIDLLLSFFAQNKLDAKAK